MVLHCGYTFLRCIDLIYDITLWAYLPEPIVKDSQKSLSLTEKPQYRVLQLTWSHITITYVLWRGIRKHCMWRKWLTYCSCGKFITRLTFELSSFRENGFLFLPHFLHFMHKVGGTVGGTLFFMHKVGGTVGGTPFFMHKVRGTVGGTLFHPICEVGDCYYFLRAVQYHPRCYSKDYFIELYIWDDSWLKRSFKRSSVPSTEAIWKDWLWMFCNCVGCTSRLQWQAWNYNRNSFVLNKARHTWTVAAVEASV